MRHSVVLNFVAQFRHPADPAESSPTMGSCVQECPRLGLAYPAEHLGWPRDSAVAASVHRLAEVAAIRRADRSCAGSRAAAAVRCSGLVARFPDRTVYWTCARSYSWPAASEAWASRLPLAGIPQTCFAAVAASADSSAVPGKRQ